MAEKDQESSIQWTDIDDLVAETQNIEFDIIGTSPEENIDDVLKKVELFRRESSRKLYVIEEEKRKTIFINGDESFVGDEDDDNDDGDDDDEDNDDTPEDSGETTSSTPTNSEHNGDTPAIEKKTNADEVDEQKKALKTLRDIKRSLKDLKSFKIDDTAAEERGDCRLRSSSSTNRLQRPKSSYPILESTRLFDNDLIRTNNNKAKKPMFDINTLNRELANLLSMSDAPFDPSQLDEQEETTSPKPVPATPPCTPAYTFQTHPLSPSELNARKGFSQTQAMADVKPPPKPPRLNSTPAKNVEMLENLSETDAETSVDQVVADQTNDDQMNNDQAADNDYAEGATSEAEPVASAPPPKPPRLNSVNTMDKLKMQMGKFSKSMGNLAFSGEPQAKSPPVIDSSAARKTEVVSPEIGKTFGEKMEQIFSKEKMEEIFSKEKVEKIFSFSRFKRSKKGKDISISNPTDFRQSTGSATEEEPTDEQAPFVTSEADTPTSDKNVTFISDSQAPSTPDEQEASEDSDTNTISDDNTTIKADEQTSLSTDETQTSLSTDETQTTSDQHSAPTNNILDGQVNSGFDKEEETATEAKIALGNEKPLADLEEKSAGLAEGIVNSGFDKQEENDSNKVAPGNAATTSE